MAEVLVLVERSDGVVRKATLELLTLARRLGDPAALVCGPADDAVMKALGEYGAGKVYVVDDPAIHEFLVAPKAEALVDVVRRTSPATVLDLKCVTCTLPTTAEFVQSRRRKARTLG